MLAVTIDFACQLGGCPIPTKLCVLLGEWVCHVDVNLRRPTRELTVEATNAETDRHADF